jgi:uncharacterized repeat protein (TIGR03833 family)
MVMETGRSTRQRDSIRVGMTVDVIQKVDQKTGKKTRGVIKEILTGSLTHPHGIKVRLEDGRVGRVSDIIGTGIAGTKDCPPK